MNLFIQKILYTIFNLVLYLVLVAFLICNILFCPKEEFFSIKSSSNTCTVFKVLLLVYFVSILFFIGLTLIASYITKIRSRKIIDTPDDITEESRIVIFVPVYSESKEKLIETIMSTRLDTVAVERKLLVVIVDGYNYGETIIGIKEILLVNNYHMSSSDIFEMYTGSVENLDFLLIIKKENKGKKDSFLILQKLLLIVKTRTLFYDPDIIAEAVYSELDEETFTKLLMSDYTLMLDTDTQYNKDALELLVNCLDRDHNVAAVCGQTLVTNPLDSIWTLGQVFEYWITHYTLKSVESVYGKVLVLSGCFSLYRNDIISDPKLIDSYTGETNSLEKENLYMSNVYKFGEDRLLTNLIIQQYPESHIRYLENAECKTHVPVSLSSLMRQRRRWTNSMISCHIKLLAEMGNIKTKKWWTKILLVLLLVYETCIALVLPLAMLVGYAFAIYFITSIFLSGSANIYQIISSIVFFCIPIVWCIFLGNVKMIFFSSVFMFIQPVTSIVIPFYSIWKSDDVSW